MSKKNKRKITIEIDELKPRNPLVVIVMKKATRKHKNRKREILDNLKEE
jgi:hypothetical protein